MSIQSLLFKSFFPCGFTCLFYFILLWTQACSSGGGKKKEVKLENKVVEILLACFPTSALFPFLQGVFHVMMFDRIIELANL